MKYLVIYDEIGTIINMQSGFPLPKEPIGIPFMWVEISQGKRLIKINTEIEPHQPIFEDVPKTDIELAKERIEALEKSNAELMNLIATPMK